MIVIKASGSAQFGTLLTGHTLFNAAPRVSVRPLATQKGLSARRIVAPVAQAATQQATSRSVVGKIWHAVKPNASAVQNAVTGFQTGFMLGGRSGTPWGALAGGVFGAGFGYGAGKILSHKTGVLSGVTMGVGLGARLGVAGIISGAVLGGAVGAHKKGENFLNNKWVQAAFTFQSAASLAGLRLNPAAAIGGGLPAPALKHLNLSGLNTLSQRAQAAMILGKTTRALIAADTALSGVRTLKNGAYQSLFLSSAIANGTSRIAMALGAGDSTAHALRQHTQLLGDMGLQMGVDMPLMVKGLKAGHIGLPALQNAEVVDGIPASYGVARSSEKTSGSPVRTFLRDRLADRLDGSADRLDHLQTSFASLRTPYRDAFNRFSDRVAVNTGLSSSFHFMEPAFVADGVRGGGNTGQFSAGDRVRAVADKLRSPSADTGFQAMANDAAGSGGSFVTAPVPLSPLELTASTLEAKGWPLQTIPAVKKSDQAGRLARPGDSEMTYPHHLIDEWELIEKIPIIALGTHATATRTDSVSTVRPQMTPLEVTLLQEGEGRYFVRLSNVERLFGRSSFRDPQVKNVFVRGEVSKNSDGQNVFRRTFYADVVPNKQNLLVQRDVVPIATQSFTPDHIISTLHPSLTSGVGQYIRFGVTSPLVTRFSKTPAVKGSETPGWEADQRFKNWHYRAKGDTWIRTDSRQIYDQTDSPVPMPARSEKQVAAAQTIATQHANVLRQLESAYNRPAHLSHLKAGTAHPASLHEINALFSPAGISYVPLKKPVNGKVSVVTLRIVGKPHHLKALLEQVRKARTVQEKLKIIKATGQKEGWYVQKSVEPQNLMPVHGAAGGSVVQVKQHAATSSVFDIQHFQLSEAGHWVAQSSAPPSEI